MLSIMRDTLHRLAKLPREMSQLKVGSPILLLSPISTIQLCAQSSASN